MVHLADSAGEVRRRHAAQEARLLAGQVRGVGLGEGRRGDVQHAGVAGAVVRLVDCVDCWDAC